MGVDNYKWTYCSCYYGYLTEGLFASLILTFAISTAFNLINSFPLQMPSACNLKKVLFRFSNRINSCSSGVSSGLMADRNLEEAICTYCKGWLAICSALSFIICKVQTPGTTGCPGNDPDRAWPGFSSISISCFRLLFPLYE